MKNTIDGLEIIRTIRKNIAQECKNEPEKLGIYCRNFQKNYKSKSTKKFLS